jgi:hypothetical protein
MHNGLCSLIALFALSTAMSCTAHAAATCDLLLAGGVRDYSARQNSQAYYNRFKTFLQQSESQSLSQASSESNNIGLGYAGYNVNFGSSDANRDFSQWKRDFIN